MQLMGKLLERFGDVSASVRHATKNVARAVMSNLSSQGSVSSVLPVNGSCSSCKVPAEQKRLSSSVR